MYITIKILYLFTSTWGSGSEPGFAFFALRGLCTLGKCTLIWEFSQMGGGPDMRNPTVLGPLVGAPDFGILSFPNYH